MCAFDSVDFTASVALGVFVTLTGVDLTNSDFVDLSMDEWGVWECIACVKVIFVLDVVLTATDIPLFVRLVMVSDESEESPLSRVTL